MDSEIWKGGALYAGHHSSSVKKILDFKWYKKAGITLETISFWPNIYISIFKFSPFLLIKFISFSKFTNALIRKEKKTLVQQSMRKEKLKIAGLSFKRGSFVKPFKMIINLFFLFLKFIRSAIFTFSYQGYQKGKLRTTNI